MPPSTDWGDLCIVSEPNKANKHAYFTRKFLSSLFAKNNLFIRNNHRIRFIHINGVYCLAFYRIFSIVGCHLLVQISLGSGDETPMLVYRYSNRRVCHQNTCSINFSVTVLLIKWASLRENLSPGFPHDKESKQPA